MKLEIRCQECDEWCIAEPDVEDLIWYRCPKFREFPGHGHSLFIVEFKEDAITIY